jgi:antitoxin VapB
MSLNIKNPDVEALVDEVARLAGESKTEAVRKALAERRDRLVFRDGGRRRGQRFLSYLSESVWPAAPPAELGRRLTREEEEDILGYGKDGA